MSRTLTGIVVSDKADKTIVIAVQSRKTNRIYKKQYSVTTKFMAHDEKNSAHTGDRVVIVETRPLSARKRFILQEIVETAKISEKDRVEKVTAVEDVPPAKEKVSTKKAADTSTESDEKEEKA